MELRVKYFHNEKESKKPFFEVFLLFLEWFLLDVY